MKIKSIIAISAVVLTLSCGSKKNDTSVSDVEMNKSVLENSEKESKQPQFDADSAYFYVEKQVSFGPRVPNTDAHRQCSDWLMSELKRHGADVIEQCADLKAFDGTILKTRNIMGSFNLEATDRLLLLAHWDCRPWADADSNPQNHKKPVDGANDGASGVGVLLEIARQISAFSTEKGIDILFVDAEDWGTEGDDDSWALGTKYFVENPIRPGYFPSEAILLDMVGGHNAVFRREMFSAANASDLVDRVWSVAAKSGYSAKFSYEIGGAVTDDHVVLLKAGIPAIDIIEFHPVSGFNPTWHTIYDNMDGIDRQSLKAVGQTVVNYIHQ